MILDLLDNKCWKILSRNSKSNDTWHEITHKNRHRTADILISGWSCWEREKGLDSASCYWILLLQQIIQWRRQLRKQAIKIKRTSMFALINRVQLWACEKQLKSIEFRRKKIFRQYFLALELKNSQITVHYFSKCQW